MCFCQRPCKERSLMCSIYLQFSPCWFSTLVFVCARSWFGRACFSCRASRARWTAGRDASRRRWRPPRTDDPGRCTPLPATGGCRCASTWSRSFAWMSMPETTKVLYSASSSGFANCRTPACLQIEIGASQAAQSVGWNWLHRCFIFAASIIAPHVCSLHFRSRKWCPLLV